MHFGPMKSRRKGDEKQMKIRRKADEMPMKCRQKPINADKSRSAPGPAPKTQAISFS